MCKHAHKTMHSLEAKVEMFPNNCSKAIQANEQNYTDAQYKHFYQAIKENNKYYF